MRNRLSRSCNRARLTTSSEDILTLKVKARLQRVGREMRMLVENTDDQTVADPGLLTNRRSRARHPGAPDAEH